MKKSLFIILEVFVALIATPSCKKEKGTEGPPAIEVSGVSVDKTTVGLMVGETSETCRDGHSGRCDE